MSDHYKSQTRIVTITKILIVMVGILLFVSKICHAAGTQPSWYEHVDLMSLAVYALGLLVLFFIARTLRQVDKNQSALFTRITNLEKDFYTLRGEHIAIVGGCKDGKRTI